MSHHLYFSNNTDRLFPILAFAKSLLSIYGEKLNKDFVARVELDFGPFSDGNYINGPTPSSVTSGPEKSLNQFGAANPEVRCSDLLEKIEDLRDVLKEIYNVASFDYDTMPEPMRREIFGAVLELAEKGLNIK